MLSSPHVVEVTHLDDAGGSTPPVATNLETELVGILTRAQHELEEIDTLIQVADQLLENLQPHAPGKIRITWWRKRRQNELTPVFVQLKVGVGGRWYLDSVSTRDVHKLVKRASEFQANHILVYRTVVLAKELIKRRGGLLGLVRQHMQSINNTFQYQATARSKLFRELETIYTESAQSKEKR